MADQPDHGTYIVPRDDPASIERRNVMGKPGWSLIKAPDNICPRCGGDVPIPGRKGEYPGAASRTDNATEICSACGNEEAYEQFPGHDDQLAPQSEWPIPADKIRDRRRPVADWNTSRGMAFVVATPRPMPKEVPDLRLHLLDRWVEGGIFWRTIEARIAVNQIRGHPSVHADTERRTLSSATLWWIKEEMLAITLSAAPVIPADATGKDVADSLPDPSGMVVLEVPWIGEDAERDGEQVQVDVFTWGLTRVEGISCISISCYRYLDFGTGMNSPEMQEALATGALFQAIQEARQTSQGQNVPRLRGGSWMFLGRTDWPLHDTIETPLPDMAGVPLTKQRMSSHEEDRRVLAAFSVLIKAKLSERDVIYAQRPMRRRAARAGITDTKISNVTLVRLREHRKEEEVESLPGEERKHVEWSHRWVSKGHPGWRWYGQGRKKRRLAWISPSIKGPDDKPLIVKERVNLWVR